jgi:hypothetical protein
LKTTIAAFLAVAALAGCASGGPPPFPNARDAVVRVVLVPQIEVGEYLIPGSQVIITGSVVSSGLGARESALAMRFEDIITDRLKEARIGHATSVWPERVVLIPKARLQRNGDRATLLCTLEAQYSAGGMADSFVHRVYSYAAPQARPLVGTGDGWTDREGVPFQDATRTAFARLADAFIADWNGRLSPANAPTVHFRRGDAREPASGRLLLDMGDFVAIGDSPVDSSRKSVFVVERAALVP